MQGCGCKICKAGLGEHVNHWIEEGWEPKQVIEELKSSGIKISSSLLKKHLAAFGIPYPQSKDGNDFYSTPVSVDLNQIDFSEYDFEINDTESIVFYLQKINLKIYLNQSRITLQAQQDVIDGKTPDMPKEIMQNLAIAFQILDKSTGLSTNVNQQSAIKVVEGMGLLIQKPIGYLNVQNSAKPEAN